MLMVKATTMRKRNEERKLSDQYLFYGWQQFSLLSCGCITPIKFKDSIDINHLATDNAVKLLTIVTILLSAALSYTQSQKLIQTVRSHNIKSPLRHCNNWPVGATRRAPSKDVIQ